MTALARIGVVDDIQARRESTVTAQAGRLSPFALHLLDPTRFARPLPTDAATEYGRKLLALEGEVKAAKENNRELMQENGQLRRRIADLLAPKGVSPAIAVEVVMDVFCAQMAAAGRTLNNGTAYVVADLKSPCRGIDYTGPRHVCMWVAKRLCRGASYPRMAVAFGRSDHTTALSACKRAPEWMAEDPVLKSVADATLKAFGA